jgi:hypothetical protein
MEEASTPFTPDLMIDDMAGHVHHNMMGNNDDDNPFKKTASPHPKYLPDIDDMAMNSVMEYMDYRDHDLYFSFISNSMFIAGGISYVALSLWRMDKYYGLDLIAPLVYFVNAIVDIIWARKVVELGKVKRKLAHGWEEWRVTSGESLANSSADGEPIATPYLDPNLSKKQQQNQQPWYHRLYKHTAHRRSHLAAFTFGLAAGFAVCQVLVDWYLPGSEHISDACGRLSVHIYLISAIVCITGKRNRPWFQGFHQLFNSPNALEDLGDVFFLVGSCLDETLMDVTWDDNNADMWALVSALLWLADACFYFRGDVLIMNARKADNSQSTHSLV